MAPLRVLASLYALTGLVNSLAVTPKWSSTCSTSQPGLAQVALDEALSLFEFERGAEADAPDLVILCVGQPFEKRFVELADAAAARLGAKVLVSVLGGGVVGGGREHEFEPCISVLGGALPPGTEASPFVLGRRAPGAPFDSDNWSKVVAPLFSRLQRTEAHAKPAAFLLFGDPQSAIDTAVEFIDESCPTSVVVGGLTCPLQRDVPSIALHEDGAARTVTPGSVVGVALRGPRLEVHSITAQGAVGVGPVMRVTACPRPNVIAQLDGKKAVDRLRECAAEAVAAQPRLDAQMKTGVLVGVSNRGLREGAAAVVDDGFLVRAVAGATTDGSLVIGDGKIRAGSTLQLHVRDGDAARADLRQVLQRYALERAFAYSPGANPLAVFLVACSGRGEALFGNRGHDSDAIRAAFDYAVPVGGFFANGELGPIAATAAADEQKATHLHGFTSVAAILYDSGDAENGGG
ncbi:FIST C domain-containing protein [Pelagophyceae sp. CCMP2097]|nr:FIST C domain-containing protein [Pelagophyceae sp. CCMP2097]|mmetsp:Transcript_22880/g.78295  ORF Transcript_22880/g.78295 Transcript_22880/m.78295 type:complete len:463 (-) Transcript_22880:9-1397(-)